MEKHSRKFRKATLILGLLLVMSLATIFLSWRDARFQGRPLTFWMKGLPQTQSITGLTLRWNPSGDFPDTPDEAIAAFHAKGARNQRMILRHFKPQPLLPFGWWKKMTGFFKTTPQNKSDRQLEIERATTALLLIPPTPELQKKLNRLVKDPEVGQEVRAVLQAWNQPGYCADLFSLSLNPTNRPPEIVKIQFELSSVYLFDNKLTNTRNLSAVCYLSPDFKIIEGPFLGNGYRKYKQTKDFLITKTIIHTAVDSTKPDKKLLSAGELPDKTQIVRIEPVGPNSSLGLSIEYLGWLAFCGTVQSTNQSVRYPVGPPSRAAEYVSHVEELDALAKLPLKISWTKPPEIKKSIFRVEGTTNFAQRVFPTTFTFTDDSSSRKLVVQGKAISFSLLNSDQFLQQLYKPRNGSALNSQSGNR